MVDPKAAEPPPPPPPPPLPPANGRLAQPELPPSSSTSTATTSAATSAAPAPATTAATVATVANTPAAGGSSGCLAKREPPNGAGGAALPVPPQAQQPTLLDRRRKPSSLLYIVRLADSFPQELERQILVSPSEDRGLPLRVGERDTLVGFVSPRVLEDVKGHPATFEVRPDAVRFAAGLDTPELRTAAVDAFFRQLRSKDKYPCLKGWRDEVYAVYGAEDGGAGFLDRGAAAAGAGDSRPAASPAAPTGDAAGGGQRPESGSSASNEHSGAAVHKKPLLLCECSAAGILGFRSYGCRLNGYMRLESGEIKLWISLRSVSRPVHSGMLDNLAAGDLTAGVLPYDNLKTKCVKEASIPERVARKAVPSGAVTFFAQNEERGWTPSTEYVYDLELDCSFLPTSVDGNVDGFLLLDFHTVIDHVRKGDFVPAAAVAVIDFFIRHGYIHPANEPDYLEIVARIHRRHCAPGPRFCETDLNPRPRPDLTVSIAVAAFPPSALRLASATTPSGLVVPPQPPPARTPTSSLFKPILPSPFVTTADPILAKSNTEVIPRIKRGMKPKSAPPAQSPIQSELSAPSADGGGDSAGGRPEFRFPPSALDHPGPDAFPLRPPASPNSARSPASGKTATASPAPPRKPKAAEFGRAEPLSPGAAAIRPRAAAAAGLINAGAGEDEGRARPKRRHGNCSVCGQPGCIGRNKRARCPKWPGEVGSTTTTTTSSTTATTTGA